MPTELIIAYTLFLFVVLYVAITMKSVVNAMFNITWSIWPIIAWLCLTAAASTSGFLLDFSATPPRIALLIVPPFATVIYIVSRRSITPWLDAQPLTTLILPQTFRIVVEVVLWLLFLSGKLASLLTFEGRNFDVIAGIGAVAAYLYLRRTPSAAVSLIFNITGLLLLVNVTVHGIGSTPTALNIFTTVPPNTIMATWPMVWLPAFVVPSAYLLHFLSLRQTLRYRTTLSTK